MEGARIAISEESSLSVWLRLSYTQFEYSNLSASGEQLHEGETVTLIVDVKNVGEVAGDEVFRFISVPIVRGMPCDNWWPSSVFIWLQKRPSRSHLRFPGTIHAGAG